jgi:mitochondrial chaperone BCS1
MWESIWQFIHKQMESNQVFTGGLVLMLGGALLAYFRDLPAKLWSWLRGLWIIEIDVLDRDPAFEWIDLWLTQHSYSQKFARWLTVKTQPVDFYQRQENPDADTRPRILFSPAPGHHYLFYRGRLVVLHRERPDLKELSNQAANASVREAFSITIYSRDRRIAQQLLEDARDVALPPGKKRLAVYRPSYSSWTEQMQRLPRPADSVILRDHDLPELIDDVRLFLQRRAWYLERGLPYRRGYLLHGPPGTGKSSAVLAVASELRMDLALLSLNSASLDDHELGELLCDAPTNAIILIEDIDCAFVERERTAEKANRLTFSGLLNALDGVAAGEGRVLFATTNHPERLDPALIRPGRIDHQLEIGYATREQAQRLFNRFFPNCVDPALSELFGEMIPPQRYSMSHLQTHLIRYSHDPDEALERLDALLDAPADSSTPHLWPGDSEPFACSVGL